MYRDAGYIEHIPYIFICAGYREGGKDSCEVIKRLQQNEIENYSLRQIKVFIIREKKKKKKNLIDKF